MAIQPTDSIHSINTVKAGKLIVPTSDCFGILNTLMKSLVGLLGYPLGHSISPAFQQAAFDFYSLNTTYEAWPTPPDLLQSKVASLRNPEYLGANITVPHKERIQDMVDVMDPEAEKIGAVNTIVNNRGSLEGHNTDSRGFMIPLKKLAGFDIVGKKILLVGAGGAARAAVFALSSEPIQSLTISNRTQVKAKNLADIVRDLVPEISHTGLESPEFAQAVSQADIIVNSTSIGMSGTEDTRLSPIPTSWISPNSLVYDMVYNPPITPLLSEALRAGASVLGGLPMLVQQGALAFEKWTQLDAPIDLMSKAAAEALSKT